MSRKKSFLTLFSVPCPPIRHSNQQFKNCIVSSLLLITHSSSAAAAAEGARAQFFFFSCRCRHVHPRRAGRRRRRSPPFRQTAPPPLKSRRARSPPSPNRRFPSGKKSPLFISTRPRKQFLLEADLKTVSLVMIRLLRDFYRLLLTHLQDFANSLALEKLEFKIEIYFDKLYLQPMGLGEEEF